AYFAAKKKFDDLGFIRTHLWPFKDSENTKKFEAEEKIAKDQYERVRGEYIANNIDNFINEKTELLKFRLQQRAEKKSNIVSKGIKKAADAVNRAYETSSKYNVERLLSDKYREKLDKVILPAKSFNIKGREISLPELHLGRALAR